LHIQTEFTFEFITLLKECVITEVDVTSCLKEWLTQAVLMTTSVI